MRKPDNPVDIMTQKLVARRAVDNPPVFLSEINNDILS